MKLRKSKQSSEESSEASASPALSKRDHPGYSIEAQGEDDSASDDIILPPALEGKYSIY